MRSKNELIDITLKLFEEMNPNGICVCFDILYNENTITRDECIFLKEFLEKNKPLEPYNIAYYFKPWDREARINFLNSLKDPS